MPRMPRAVVEGLPHHVTQRGNGQQSVFRGDADYLLYLDLLRANSHKHGLTLWAYCLMPNHVHLIAVPQQDLSLARALGRTHADYARYFNLRRGSCGHLWQARFYSCPLEGAHLLRAVAYVERNPVRAGLVEEAAQYRWSSAAARQAGWDAAGLIDLRPWPQEYHGERWREVLATSLAEEAIAERLREATLRGRPMGSPDFTMELEKKSGRRLRPRPVGRPRARPAVKQRQLSLEIGN